MWVSINRATSKSSIYRGFSPINHPFSGTPIYGNLYIEAQFCMFPICVESFPIQCISVSGGETLIHPAVKSNIMVHQNVSRNTFLAFFVRVAVSSYTSHLDGECTT